MQVLQGVAWSPGTVNMRLPLELGFSTGQGRPVSSQKPECEFMVLVIAQSRTQHLIQRLVRQPRGIVQRTKTAHGTCCSRRRHQLPHALSNRGRGAGRIMLCEKGQSPRSHTVQFH